MNAIVKHEGQLVTAEHAAAIRSALKSSLYPGASDSSVDMVLAYCQAAKLDPMTKPVHIVPMWDSKAKSMRDVVMPGIGLYRTQAARSGELAGISEPEFGQMVTQRVGRVEVTFPEWCRVVVKRQLRSGLVAEFSATEYWIENYAPKGGAEKDESPNAMWMKRPRGQLAKCAQAQALRVAFPEFGSQPTADEMEGKTLGVEVVDVTQPPVQQARPELPPCSDENIKNSSASWREIFASGKSSAESVIAKLETRFTLTEAQRREIKALEPIDAAEAEGAE